MEEENKEKKLTDFFKNHQNVLIAFSGGADSALLAAAAVTAGTTAGTKMLAVTVKTEFVPDKEIQTAQETANEIGISHIFIEKNLLDFPEIKNNQKNRCYVCKKELLETLLKYAEENGFETVVEGTNYSDVQLNEAGKIPRPGFLAIQELKKRQNEKKDRGKISPSIESPLADLKITKEEVRNIAQNKNLSVSKKPSGSCLATRFSYETEITADHLKTIDSAEQKIKEIGAKQIRIRCHTDTAGRNFARIEVEENEKKIFFDQKNQTVVEELIVFLKQSGFSYVTVDLEGFRSGSMDI